ncbi:MAG: sugar phosphate isomerase/epimerase [Armatimonadetes bacterium]|nr:sugar phosphate isomerase/epimerase [Armatimonadota bacterium]MDE2206620.1 sugar phosphate isomerase/epimerase [Armatimonadota bacterium]
MSRADHKDIRIGTLARMTPDPAYIKSLIPHGFESFQLTVWDVLRGLDLAACAPAALDAVGDQAVISSIGMFGNPLQKEEAARDWETCIRAARSFNCSMVCGFAGALEDRPLPESVPKYKEVWGHLARVAEGEGVRIAFENCDMGGSWERPRWNIAHAPRAWEMLFNEVPSEAIGLEWEPCHQMASLIDPLPQLRKWVHRIYHIHGKDATVAWDIVRDQGIRSGVEYVWHRTPGFGDTNWTDVISILRMGGYMGSIDIEGWHDPVYRDELEITGQVHALNYLKQCRGGAWIPPE